MAQNTNDNIAGWSENPSENQAFGDIKWYEGMPPSMVNNSARAMMAAIRKYYQDKTYAREPVLGGNNLQVTLDNTFDDYVDGMVVRFRIPNNFSATVPDNLLLCVNNIPSDKRGNGGSGAAMYALQWNATAKKLGFAQAKGSMFTPGVHINAIFSKIHHGWTQADYAAEQKGTSHLTGDTAALLQNDPHWQQYADDPGIFFIFSDSDMSAINDMINDKTDDLLKCLKLDPTVPTDHPQLLGVVDNSTYGPSCMKLMRIPYSAQISQRQNYLNAGDYSWDVPPGLQYIYLILQGAGGSGGCFTNDGADGAASTITAAMNDGSSVLLATADGGQRGDGGTNASDPKYGGAGTGHINAPGNMVYSVLVANTPSGRGIKDWLESTGSKAGGIGQGGQTLGAYGVGGAPTGCLPQDGQGAMRQPQLFGKMGGGGAGGLGDGCRWGSGGGAGGYCEFVITATNIKTLNIHVGAGGVTTGQPYASVGGDGYAIIQW